jgi:hypothetical protein
MIITEISDLQIALNFYNADRNSLYQRNLNASQERRRGFVLWLKSLQSKRPDTVPFDRWSLNFRDSFPCSADHNFVQATGDQID